MGETVFEEDLEMHVGLRHVDVGLRSSSAERMTQDAY